jgi:hypothetical protein
MFAKGGSIEAEGVSTGSNGFRQDLGNLGREKNPCSKLNNDQI